MELVTPVLEYLHPNNWGRRSKIAGACIGAVFVLFQIRKFKKKQTMSRLRKSWNAAGKDVVVLHQFLRGRTCPNLSPFALKIESYLRLSNIEYIVDTDMEFGPSRKKCPWITLNGEDTEDSEFIKETLKKQFSVTLDDHLKAEERAQLESLRILVDEHLFWCVLTWRYYHDKCKSFMTTQNFPGFLQTAFPWFMVPGIKRKSRVHGMGIFTVDEVFNIFKRDCETLSITLGMKNFFGGDNPVSADCSIFGMLAQIMWNAPNTRYENVLIKTYPNLGEYCHRMKTRIYPDWNKLLNPPI